VLVGLTYAGMFAALWIVLGIVAAVALRRPTLALLVVLCVAAADLAATAVKHSVDRRRPHDALGVDTLVETPTSPAFPSGHASTSFAAAVVLSVALPRLAPAFFVLAALVAYSRLYTGVHYPLDVMGGAVLGAAVATALLLLARAPRRWRRPQTRARPRGR
jgi:undecaprenyl-diphosphatase